MDFDDFGDFLGDADSSEALNFDNFGDFLGDADLSEALDFEDFLCAAVD